MLAPPRRQHHRIPISAGAHQRSNDLVPGRGARNLPAKHGIQMLTADAQPTGKDRHRDLRLRTQLPQPRAEIRYDPAIARNSHEAPPSLKDHRAEVRRPAMRTSPG